MPWLGHIGHAAGNAIGMARAVAEVRRCGGFANYDYAAPVK